MLTDSMILLVARCVVSQTAGFVASQHPLAVAQFHFQAARSVPSQPGSTLVHPLSYLVASENHIREGVASDLWRNLWLLKALW